MDSIRSNIENGKVGYILRSPLKSARKHNFFSHVLEGFESYLASKGIEAVFYGGEEELEPVELRQAMDGDNSLLGLVVMGETQDAFFQELSKSVKPIVCVNATFPGLCHSVNANEFQAAQKLLQHFKDLGHRRLGYVGSEKPVAVNRARLEALKRAIQIYNFRFADEHHIIVPEATRKSGHDAAERILAIAEEQRPTGWICSGGVLARGLVEVLVEKGVSFGEDFGVSAFDQTRMLTAEKPRITGAATNPEELGRISAKVLFESFSKEENLFQEFVIPADIQMFETTQT